MARRNNHLGTAGFQAITKNRTFYIMLVALVTCVIFFQVIGYEFVWYDDDFTVYKNPYVQSVTVQNIVHAWKNPYKDSYMPATITLLAIEGLFARTTPSDANSIEFNPAVFHTSNLIFHILNAILVFLILRILIKDELPSFFGALLFALHPVQVESVAWITGVKDVFSGFLSLVAIWQYLLYAQLSMEGNKTDQDNRDRNRKIMHYLIAIVSFILALLAKPTRVVVPIIVFTLDYLILKRQFKHIAASIIGWIVISLPVIVATIVLMPASNEATSGISLLERFLVSSDSLVFYLYKLIFPISLGPDYGRTIKLALSQNLFVIALLILALYFILIYKIKQYRSWLLASAIVFVAGVLPMLGFIRFQFQEVSTVADRYLYLSMIGPGIALGFFLSRYKKPSTIIISGVLLGILGVLSILQTQNWKNTVTFYKHALKINPNSATFHMYLGIVLGEQGSFDEAIYHFSEGINLEPKNSEAYNNIGIVLTYQRKFNEAIYHFNEGLRIDPNNANLLLNLGYAYAQQGKFNEAIPHYYKALILEPGNAGAHFNLGYAFTQQGNYDEAIYHYSETVRLDPKNSGAHFNLGYAFAQQGKFNEAIPHYSETVRLDPKNAWAHNNLGLAFLQQGKFNEAEYHFNAALKIIPGFQDAQKNLTKSLEK